MTHWTESTGLKLTRRQAMVLDLIIQHFETGDRQPPTVRELMDGIGVRSPNAISCHIQALERKGYVKVLPVQARGLRIVKPYPIPKSRFWRFWCALSNQNIELAPDAYAIGRVVKLAGESSSRPHGPYIELWTRRPRRPA